MNVSKRLQGRLTKLVVSMAQSDIYMSMTSQVVSLVMEITLKFTRQTTYEVERQNGTMKIMASFISYDSRS